MERFEALKRLRKMLGKEFAYEIRPDAPSEEEREAANLKRPELEAKRKAISEALAARRVVLLQDPDYQRLSQEYKDADKAVSQNNGKMYLHKITVGTANKLFFHVKAQGNSWEDIFAKLKADKR